MFGFMFGSILWFSGLEIRINLKCIDVIEDKQDGGQIAFIGIQDGGQAFNLLFENRDHYKSDKTLQLKYTCKILFRMDLRRGYSNY